MARPRWFGPKRIGWGWRPITVEGWIATAVFVAVVVGLWSVTGWGVAVAFALYFAVVALTGGKPGHAGLGDRSEDTNR